MSPLTDQPPISTWGELDLTCSVKLVYCTLHIARMLNPDTDSQEEEEELLIQENLHLDVTFFGDFLE